jgi:DNA modification methylase
MELNKIYHGDSLEVLKTFPSESVDCVITSPPYFGLRDYGVEGQIGLEETPKIYVDKLVLVFREVKRVLKDDGTLWLNLGDSYSGSMREYNPKGTKNYVNSNLQKGNKGSFVPPPDWDKIGLKPKDLIGIPWRVAFALQKEGWYLRQDIIWHKPNPMPESVTDRCTKAHEYIFLLSKSPKYFFDNETIKEPVAESSIKRIEYGWHGKGDDGLGNYAGLGQIEKMGERFCNTERGRNKRSVWRVTTGSYIGAHFATFPEKLIEPMIFAGCPKGGIVLDIFMGAGTTGVVAKKLGRNYIGIELNEEYIKIAEKRISDIPVPMI